MRFLSLNSYGNSGAEWAVLNGPWYVEVLPVSERIFFSCEIAS
jgi:hypothetical protein